MKHLSLASKSRHVNGLPQAAECTELYRIPLGNGPTLVAEKCASSGAGGSFTFSGKKIVLE